MMQHSVLSNGQDRQASSTQSGNSVSQLEHDDHGLSLVMREIVDLMGGLGAFLTMHPENGSRPNLLFIDRRLGDQGFTPLVSEVIDTMRPSYSDGMSSWRAVQRDPAVSILLMPVERAAGHSRLMIAVVFVGMSEDNRERAERLYRERRPFAVGYFHLWQTNRALAQRTKSLELALDQTAIGVLLLNSDSRILFANRTGEEILTAGDGLGRSNGSPRATRLADGINLQAALSHALNADPAYNDETESEKTPLFAFRRHSGPPLIAALLPSGNRSLQSSDIAAIMYIVDPVLDTTDILTPLCRLYGLSPVETRLACHLARGSTVGDAAATMRIKEQTARGYLKTMFIKTDTNRQTELVALLLSSVIRMKNHSLQEALPLARSERVPQHYS